MNLSDSVAFENPQVTRSPNIIDIAHSYPLVDTVQYCTISIQLYNVTENMFLSMPCTALSVLVLFIYGHVSEIKVKLNSNAFECVQTSGVVLLKTSCPLMTSRITLSLSWLYSS